MSYMAYLCYPRPLMGDDLEDNEPVIKFEQPEDISECVWLKENN